MSIWLTISSYRNDDEVLRLVKRAQDSAVDIFDRILIVDSQGTGRVPSEIESHGWTNVEYRSYEKNLGSGGNLAERLRIAADCGARYAYALNHDGDIHPAVIRKLIEAADICDHIGAAYPLAYFTEIRRYNVTGTRELPLPAKLVKSIPHESTIAVHWSSSNGALYSLKPALQGILPEHAMWMGWEDLEYGWRLEDNGYEQIIVTEALFPDNQEYSNTALGNVVRKPPWRTYYNMRNLALAVRRSRNHALYHAVVFLRLLGECAQTCLVRDEKVKRLRLLLIGVWDGYRGADRFANCKEGSPVS